MEAEVTTPNKLNNHPWLTGNQWLCPVAQFYRQLRPTALPCTVSYAFLAALLGFGVASIQRRDAQGLNNPEDPLVVDRRVGESTLKTYSGNLWKKTRERREERERGEREEREIDRERGPERCDKKLFAKLAMVIMLHNVVNHPNL